MTLAVTDCPLNVWDTNEYLIKTTSKIHTAMFDSLPGCTDWVSQHFWFIAAPDKGEVKVTVNTWLEKRSHSVKSTIW